MRDWQTYRNGNSRAIWDLERLSRHRAAKLGCRVHRSRRRKGRDNAGQFMLVHKASSTKLRLTPQSRQSARTADQVRRRTSQGVGRRPWDDW
jgi:hypothetical protein